MLTNVPTQINRLARNVVINHPNTFNCQVFRKVITRKEPESVGGLPTLGGLGELNGNDEEAFSYTWVGNGYAMPAEQFGASGMMDRGDANNGSANELRFLIEPEDGPGQPGHFTPKKEDVMYLLLGVGLDAAKLAFEIVDIETTSNIPPFTQRFITNRRDDLHVAAGER